MARSPAEPPDRLIQLTGGHLNPVSVALFHNAFSPVHPRDRKEMWMHYAAEEHFEAFWSPIADPVARTYLKICRGRFTYVYGTAGSGHMMGHRQEICHGQKSLLIME